MSASSKHLPPPISPVKWKEYSLSQAWGVKAIPPSRDSSTSNLPKPGHLSPHKKEVILDLKMREENRAARFKLRSTIIQELTNRLGPKYKKEIPSHVDTLLSRKKNVTPDDVYELELFIRGNCFPSCPTTTRLPSATSTDQMEFQDSKPQNDNNSNNNNCNTINKNASTEKPSTPLPVGTEWEQLTLYQTIEHDRIIQENELKKAQSKKLLAAQLAVQVEEGKMRREREKAEDIAYAESIKRDVEKYKEESNAMYFRKHHENTLKLKDFKTQIEAEKRLKNQQKELLEFETKQELERIRAGLEYEQRLQREKKDKEMRIHRETVAENEENNRQKSIKKQREQEEEMKRSQFYEERLQAEEVARHEAFQKRLEKIEKNRQMLSKLHSSDEFSGDSTSSPHLISKHGQSESNDDEPQFTWENPNEIRKNQLKHETLLKIKLENIETMKQKNELNRRQREMEQKEGLKLKTETEQFYELEKKKRAQEQLNKKNYGLSLQHQIETNTNSPMSAMTKPEKSLNQRELKVINTDPNLHSRIAHRLRMQTAPSNHNGTHLGSMTPSEDSGEGFYNGHGTSGSGSGSGSNNGGGMTSRGKRTIVARPF